MKWELIKKRQKVKRFREDLIFVKRMGDRKMKTNLLSTGSLLLLTFWGTNASAALGLPTTEAECLTTYDMQVPDMSQLTPENQCQNSMQMAGVGEKCEAVYTKLQEVYRKAEDRLKKHCADAHKLAAFDQACGANMASENCTKQGAELQATALSFVQEHRQNVAMLKSELDAAKNLGIEGAEQVLGNLKDLNSVPVSNRDISTPASAEAGAGSVNEALQVVHAGQSIPQLASMIEEVRKPSTISGGKLNSLDSMPAYEVLQGAEIAKSVNENLSDFDKKLAQQERDLKAANQTTSKNAANHKTAGTEDISGSDQNGQNLTNAAGGAGTLASAAGSGGSSGGGLGGNNIFDMAGNPSTAAKSATNLGTKASTNAAILAAAGGSTLLDSKGNPVAAKEGTNASAASRLDPTAAAALREKLRMKMAGSGSAGSDGVSANAAGAAGILGANGKPKANGASGKFASGANLSPEELNMLTGTTKLSNASNFSLQGSETDASVQEMVREFEGQLAAERGLASEDLQGEPDGIGEENSANLFSRMKDVFDRCLKRGCVSASRGSS